MRTNVPAGTVLYKMLWHGWPEEIATWEEEERRTFPEGKLILLHNMMRLGVPMRYGWWMMPPMQWTATRAMTSRRGVGPADSGFA